MKRIVVFCGSSSGTDSKYEAVARQLGQQLARKQTDLIYGGADIGLMGAVANGALQEGGKVIGVIPTFLRTKEIAHEGLTELVLVESMHERKKKMNELSDGVIALPGGFGTLEELFEMLTWAQLGLHQKPIGLLNIDGYYDHLIHFIQHMVDKGFLKTIHQEMVLVSDTTDELLHKMQQYHAPDLGKWLTNTTT